VSDVQPSLAEELGKAFDDESAVVDMPVPEGDAAGVDTVAGAGGEDTTPAAAGEDKPAGERARDAQGRFIKTEAEKEAEAQAGSQPAEAAKPPEPKPVQTVDLPPSTWTPQAKAEYAKLPEVIRSEIKKREADFQKGIDQYKHLAETGNRLLAEFRPYEAIMRAKGSTPEVAMRNMLNTAYVLETGTPQQKAQLLIQAAQQYGADLSPYMGQSQPQEGQQPDLRAMVDQLIQQRMQPIQSQFLTAQQQQEQARAVETQSQIEAFRTATDEKGSPKHVYFDNVRGIMASLLEAGNARSMDEAYVMACRAHPEVSAALSAEQRKDSEARQLAEQRRKAEEARRAGSVNVSGQGGVGIADTSKVSLRDELAGYLDGRL